MSSRTEGLKVFSGTANPALANEIAEHLHIDLGKMEVGRFTNGETHVLIQENVRGEDVFVIQPTGAPANDTLMELLIIIDALLRASAHRITAVIPYYGYARQDRKTRGREPITAKLVANLLTTARAGRVLTMDLHAGQIQGFFDLPVDHLSAMPLLAEHFRQRALQNVVVVSPDVGGVPRARDVARRLGTGVAFLDKRHPRPGISEVIHVVGSVRGMKAILVDDMIDTAGSISNGARALVEKGAAEVYACCTHAVLSGPASDRLADSPIRDLVVTNTLAIDRSRLPAKVTVLSVAPLLGEAITRIHEDRSVSELFS
ncbi:MAG TPA: ribose-phosphate pyrophosphokinase [Clostridiales bacterium]|nr:ribose-phosphate pyrophosphokinase [Clostridiales bacterium]